MCDKIYTVLKRKEERHLSTCLKVIMPFLKPMAGFKFFVNTIKPMPKFKPYI